MGGGQNFFVPDTTLENQETVYSDFARGCHCVVPTGKERVFSITYVHDGEEWTATVGENLRGIKKVTSRSKGKKVQRKFTVSDPAIVLAIFPGNPFMVVTNHRIAGNNVGSAWVNPFMAGQPTSITYFSGE